MIAGPYAGPMAQEPGRPPAKYRRIAADLRSRIEAGQYPVGTQLPVKTALMETHGAALGTVDAALAELRDLGLVETRHGAGTFVISDQPSETEAQQLSDQVASLRAQVAGLAKRVENAEDASLREIVGRLQANLADLYGKTGFTYPEDEAPERQPDRMVRHG